MTINEIEEKIKDVLKSTAAVMAIDTAVASVQAVNPVLGIGAAATGTFLKELYNYKRQKMLEGLAQNGDYDRALSSLAKYIQNDSERAFYVGSIFQKVLEAESPTVCMLYGLILSKHKPDDEVSFSMEEMIVAKALSSASDFDLKNFRIIMSKYIKVQEDGSKQVVYDEELTDNINALNTTALWAVYNRLFTNAALEWGVFPMDSSKVMTQMYIQPPAELLFELLNESDGKTD